MSAAQQLIARAPLQTLIETWESDLKVIQRCSPSSDGAHVHRRILAELRSAMDAAQNSVPELSVAEVAEHMRMPTSTVANICRNYGKEVGAVKRYGKWWITLEEFARAESRGIKSKNETRKRK